MPQFKFVRLVTGMVAIAATCPLAGYSNENRQPESWREGYIEGSIDSNPYLRGSRVQVEVIDRTARLSGTASSELAKALAEQIALSARGVGQVENRLEVASSRPLNNTSAETDRARVANVPIDNKVRARLLAHAQTRRLKINTETCDRVVTIGGSVSSPMEKELVYWLVKNTNGVKAVVDKLDVTVPAQVQAGL